MNLRLLLHELFQKGQVVECKKKVNLDRYLMIYIYIYMIYIYNYIYIYMIYIYIYIYYIILYDIYVLHTSPSSMCVFPTCEAHLSVAKLLLQYGALSKCKDEVRVVHGAIFHSG